ncbi:fatty acid synthase subunit beta [Apiospora kogelbergensis]|uniref:fatty acid synthase subunit beta n=1 Tax=Apiospora kogelbergensis TaxID=1337665 RepID=UPI00312CFA00
MASSDENTSSFDEVYRSPGMIGTPGLFTPQTPGNLTTFSIRYQSIHVEFRLRSSDVTQLSEYRRAYLASLEHAGDDHSDGGKVQPASSASLAFGFMEYLLANIAPLGIITRLFQTVRSDILQEQEIHCFLAGLGDSTTARKSILRTYMALVAKLAIPLPSVPSALLNRARKENASQFLIAFGGQSSQNPNSVEDLAELYSLYKPLLAPLVASLSGVLLSLTRHRDTKAFYLGREIDLLAWLEDPAKRPSKSFIAGAAVSFPIIGVEGLLHYYVLGQVLGKSPGELGQSLAGVTGHSQGIVLAAAVAKAHDWESFFVEAKWAIELLFWIGYESQMAAPQSSLNPAMINDCVEGGEGAPSHMLLVRGMFKGTLEDVIAQGNQHLPEEERLYLSLINNPTDHVVAGPPRSLRGLVLRIREIRAKDGLDQSRIPYSKRKPVISLAFLPICAPFHTPYLQGAAGKIASRIAGSWPDAAKVSSLRVPVFDTEKGLDLRAAHEPEEDLAQLLINAVTTRVVDWPNALQVGNETKYSHIIALGLGRFAGMVQQNVDGRGVRVIDGTKLDTADITVMGGKTEIFAPRSTGLISTSASVKSWEEHFKPRCVWSTEDDHYRLETRLSQVLKAPPIIVPGMTPTTVPWDFVASVTQAGYHIELAGGGYWNPTAMAAAIEKVASSIPAGHSITCNLIYVDPVAIGFQIPLIRQLISQGVPIRGLTIGAGVPSPEVAAQYIETLGIEHISFKPGSIGAIRDVIQIAKSHPMFPVILQWTGGRGGGHHSYEDFHQPLLEMYSEIRRCPNLYLVAGSGPAMPCDGVLMGSRMMVATDAHTCPGVKSLLVKAPGVDDAEWEKSYDLSTADEAGGVLTVTSEMGQPIHKIATRGVRLWKELDDTIFSLPKSERRAALLKRKPEIIRRLNADFSKPWFGEDATGKTVDVEDMTYAEVLARIVKLMYVSHQRRWVDRSYRALFADFATRALERQDSHFGFDPSLLDEPEILVAELARVCPEIAEQLLHPEDVRFFVQSCKRRDRKPINFVVALDEDFEHWFKKDSLWQSEDLNAVFGQDPERVCILQSPVAVRYSTRDDQSSKEILDEIHNDLLLRRPSCPPIVFTSDKIAVDETEEGIVVRPVLGRDLPSQDEWMACLKPHACAAFVALVQQETLFETASKRSRPNPFRRIFGARHGYSLVISRGSDQAYLRYDTTEEAVVSVKAMNSSSGWLLQVDFTHSGSVPRGPVTLALQWEFNEHNTQLIDSTPDRQRRIQDFYAHLWLGSNGPRTGVLADHFLGDEFKLTQELQHALGSAIAHAFPDGSGVGSQSKTLPLETGVIAAWDVLMSPLLISDLEGDILRLVHQSIGIEYVSGAAPMCVGDSLTTESSIRSVTIQPSGKSIAVEAKLLRGGIHMATVTSEFFIKGKFTDYQKTFSHKQEPAMELKVDTKIDEAVLRDRSWLHLDDPSMPLIGKTLVFQIHTHSRWVDQNTKSSSLQIRGTVEHLLWNGRKVTLGSITFDAPTSLGNPVMDFLERNGKSIDGKVPLKSPGWAAESEVAVVAPSHTQLYAEVSGDCNPIHTSPIFAELAELPGPIMHGMYTAAVARQVLEIVVVPGEPHRLRRFDASFVGMVQPGDRLVVGLAHVAMNSGRMVFEVVARQEESGEEVLRGEGEVEQPATAYLFTGQGSQSAGMGMALYEESPVARAIFDEMDGYIKDTYGWPILQVIRENPKQLTVHFRGRQGQRILQNYLDMKSEAIQDDGTRLAMPIIPGLSRDSTSHTFADSRGLLQSTLFAQPAIILVERATFAHMQAQGLIQEGAVFAGHSLGEYGALSSLADFVSIKDVLSITIYRGLTMQLAIPRNADGHTGYSMAAANPGRVGKHFDDTALRHIVRHIHQESGELLEIVNFNVEGDQYVCAGHVRNLYCLTEILDAAAAKKIKSAAIQEFLNSPQPNETGLGKAIAMSIEHSTTLPLGVELRRGKATIPLVGIDVPFHSSRLQPGVPAWRDFLRSRIKVEGIRPERLVDRFIPNVVGKPFSLSNAFVKEVAEITQSPALQRLVL